MKILIVLTSCGQVPNSDRKTGTWLEEFAAPYYAFKDAGATVVIASVSGGAAPIDPMSEETTAQSDATRRFAADADANYALSKTTALSAINAGDYDAVFYSGGLGPVFDLTKNQLSISLIKAMHETRQCPHKRGSSY
ncbi:MULTISPECIES: hypothetical protein [unclassified Rhizobium]